MAFSNNPTTPHFELSIVGPAPAPSQMHMNHTRTPNNPFNYIPVKRTSDDIMDEDHSPFSSHTHRPSKMMCTNESESHCPRAFSNPLLKQTTAPPKPALAISKPRSKSLRKKIPEHTMESDTEDDYVSSKTRSVINSLPAVEGTPAMRKPLLDVFRHSTREGKRKIDAHVKNVGLRQYLAMCEAAQNRILSSNFDHADHMMVIENNFSSPEELKEFLGNIDHDAVGPAWEAYQQVVHAELEKLLLKSLNSTAVNGILKEANKAAGVAARNYARKIINNA